MLFQAIGMARAFIGSLHSGEKAQDAFEYVLVVGGVTVAVILAVATPVGGSLIDAVIEGTCGAIDTIPSVDMGDCSTIIT